MLSVMSKIALSVDLANLYVLDKKPGGVDPGGVAREYRDRSLEPIGFRRRHGRGSDGVAVGTYGVCPQGKRRPLYGRSCESDGPARHAGADGRIIFI